MKDRDIGEDLLMFLEIIRIKYKYNISKEEFQKAIKDIYTKPTKEELKVLAEVKIKLNTHD